MAVRHGYGKVAGTDALVFAYDTGDTVNSYKGEPTTNYANQTLQWGPTVQTDVIDTWSGGRVGTKLSNQPDSDGGLNALGAVGGNNVNTWIGQRTSLAAEVNGSYLTFSVMLKASAETQVQIGFYQAVGGGMNIRGNATVGTSWKKYSFTVDNTSTSYVTGYQVVWILNIKNTSNTVWFYKPQIEKKSHATPFVNGTRSVSGSLLDLTGLGGINLSNVSFDSNADMTFDGTDDHIELGDLFDLADHFVDNQSFTIEAMVNIRNTDTSTSGGIFSNQKFQSQTDAPGFGLCLIPQGGAIKYCMNIVELDNSVQTSFEVKAPMAANIGNLEHVIYVYNNTANNIKAYRNGELEVTQTNVDFNWTLPTDTTRTRIGTSTQGGWGYYHEMDLPVVKCYNRALTADEVRNNYRHYKNRFGI